MPFFKNIPNLFTLLNLVFGCIAVVFILQTNETIAPLDQNGIPVNQFLPEQIFLGAIFIFLAAIVDFLDGFLARLLKAGSRMGEQLDSLRPAFTGRRVACGIFSIDHLVRVFSIAGHIYQYLVSLCHHHWSELSHGEQCKIHGNEIQGFYLQQ